MFKKAVLTSLAVLVVLVLLGWGTIRLANSRTYQLFGDITNRLDTKQPVVALTFDDGPTANVEQILPLLSQYKAKATFFVIGNELETHMEEGRRIVEAGHQLGNHTYSHQRMVFKSGSFIKREIEKTSDLIRQAGYSGEMDFRPPYGKKLVGLPRYLNRHDIPSITWNIEPDTFYTTVADKVKDVMDRASPGSIILLHPMYDKTGQELQVIEGVLEGLTAKGYRFVTVQELKEAQGK